MSCPTCNNCGKSDPCACKDTALTTPCAYTDCTDPNAEQCESIQCAECVSYCGPSFQVTDEPGGVLEVIIDVQTGERLDTVLQKFALIIADNCGSVDGDHAPYTVTVSNITTTEVTVLWSDISSISTGFNVYYGTTLQVPLTLATLAPLANTVSSYTVTGLTPGTDYRFRIEAIGSVLDCNSVEVLATTLL
jgi:hypothetical protein